MDLEKFLYNNKALKILLKSGRDINVTNYKGRSILIECVKFNVKDHVRLLLDHNADPMIIDDYGNNCVTVASKMGHDQCLQILLDYPLDVNLRNSFKETGAMLAAQFGHSSCLKMLLETGMVDVNAVNNTGCNAVMLAVQSGHQDCLHHLLQCNANPNSTNYMRGGFSALHTACTKNYIGCLKVLLDYKANVDISQVGGLTPLMSAALKGHSTCIQLLLDAGVNYNASDREGVTALMMASAKGHITSLELLLDAGANVNALDLYGFNCLQHALHGGHWQCTNLIIAYGAFVKSMVNLKFPYDFSQADDIGNRKRIADLIDAAVGLRHLRPEDDGSENKVEMVNEDGEPTSLRLQCQSLLHGILGRNYPSTNLFPLVKHLPIPVGLQRLLLDSADLEIDIPLRKALQCTSYAYRELVCIMCLRSQDELPPGLALRGCSFCNLVSYCSKTCADNHWKLAHATRNCMREDVPKFWGPFCHWCLSGYNGVHKDLITCGTCRRTRYCSQFCQESDWVMAHHRHCSKNRPQNLYANLN